MQGGVQNHTPKPKGSGRLTVGYINMLLSVGLIDWCENP